MLASLALIAGITHHLKVVRPVGATVRPRDVMVQGKRHTVLSERPDHVLAHSVNKHVVRSLGTASDALQPQAMHKA